MKKNLFFIITLLLCCKVFSQDYFRAPNSYIFDVNLPITTKGLYIPVEKAKVVWQSQEYLKEPLPTGTESVTLYWQDVPGLIRKVSLVQISSGKNIKVEVDRSKGKGNAVVAYKIDGKIYWSWHIWVTDDPTLPENTTLYTTYTPKDINNAAMPGMTFMDRNLGALSNNFIGNDWNKSSGLMYQNGRKDPFPRLMHKDLSYYELDGEAGPVRHVYHSQIDNYSRTLEPFINPQVDPSIDSVNTYLRKSIKNPLRPILPHRTIIGTDDNGYPIYKVEPEPWYSNKAFKSTNTTHNMWADNNGGVNRGFDTSSATIDRRMALKSPFDPCPNGWRVPSFWTQQANYNFMSPWGEPDNATDNVDIINPNIANADVGSMKIYPNLGSDFSQTTYRNMGKYPLTGKYTYYKDKADNLTYYFQDIQSESNIHSATMATAGEPRIFTLIKDMGRLEVNNGLGAYSVLSHGNGGTAGMAVRCVKDFNYQLTTIGGSTVQHYDFPTEYFTDTSVQDITDGLNLPNSYVISSNAKEFKFPVQKANAVYNQYLTDHEVITGNLRANILWTTNKNLVSNIQLINGCNDLSKAYIKVSLNGTGELGNVLVSLEDADTGRVFWSWHLWIPDGTPTDDTTGINYITETERTMVNTIGYTNSGAPPLNTTFMDRNLGALYKFPDNITSNSTDAELINKAENSGGLHYQWGRKDPMHSFNVVGGSKTYSLFVPNIDFDSNSNTFGNIISWQNDVTSLSTVTNQATAVYNQALTKSQKIASMLKYSAENPTTLIVETAHKDWLYGVDGIYEDRWGHATTKSVFDPCPQGWRVPDFSFLNNVSLRNNYAITTQYTDVRGTSPWYFANAGSTTTFNYENKIISTIPQTTKNEILTSFYGVPQAQPYDVATIYGGSKVMRNSSAAFGWKFNGSNGYIIGNYPVTGVLNRGNNNILAGNNVSGLWSAAPVIFQQGEASAMVINGDNLYTGTGRFQDFYPQIALNVRCVKHNDIYRGDNGPKLAAPDFSCTSLKAEDVKSKNGFDLYPNPVDDYIYVNKMGNYKYELYDISGKIVRKGEFVKLKVETKSLLKGIYIIKVTNENNEVVVKKIIKK